MFCSLTKKDSVFNFRFYDIIIYNETFVFNIKQAIPKFKQSVLKINFVE
ncbi:hypothetical protein [Arcobacter sp. CECT 8985]|nr:hypothetical protein [Arcobacter sp. CECT 8985]